MRPLSIDQFTDHMERGRVAAFRATDIEELKTFLMVALRSKIQLFSTQQEAATAWDVSEPTISYIVRGKKERFNVGFLMELVLKSSERVEIKVA